MPPRPTSRSRRLIAVAAALALSAAACGGSDGAASGTDGADGTTTTAGVGTGSASDGGTDSAGTGSTGSGTGTGSGDITSAETVPLKLTDLPPNKHGAPLPGIYLYDVAGAEAPLELSVHDVLGNQKAERFDRTGDLAQLHIETEGAERRASLVQWSTKGFFLDAEQRARNTTTGAQESAVCDFEPDLRLRPASLRVGSTWDGKSTCVATENDVTARRERTLSGEVLSESTAQVEGRTVQTLRVKWVTDTTTTTDTSPPLLLTEHREVTIEWIAASGLAARVDGTIIDTISGAPKPPRIYSWVLRSVVPTE